MRAASRRRPSSAPAAAAATAWSTCARRARRRRRPRADARRTVRGAERMKRLVLVDVLWTRLVLGTDLTAVIDTAVNHMLLPAEVAFAVSVALALRAVPRRAVVEFIVGFALLGVWIYTRTVGYQTLWKALPAGATYAIVLWSQPMRCCASPTACGPRKSCWPAPAARPDGNATGSGRRSIRRRPPGSAAILPAGDRPSPSARCIRDCRHRPSPRTLPSCRMQPCNRHAPAPGARP